MRKGVFILGIIIILGFVAFKYTLVPLLERQIQQEAAAYLGNTLSGYLTLENLNSICGLTNTEFSLFGFSVPVRSVVQTLSPQVLERCDQLALLMQILALEIYFYIVGLILIIIGILAGGGETRHHENPKQEPQNNTKKKGVKYCSECGSPNKTKDKFCGDCGKKMK